MVSSGKVAVVTVASRGIGRATALALAREDMTVVVNYSTSGERAAEVVYETNQITKGIAIQANVADGGRYILGTASQIFADAKLRNIEVMARTVREYGGY